ncbi:Hypothetical protein KVN_LOCUS452 [uncultured virus]|nr:Hypothetical protein KVN_LOCUS452 [uncultured virus]
MEHLYFLNDGQNNKYKIERSYDIENRIKQLETLNENKIILISKFVCKDCKILEKRLYNHYKNYIKNGEWFTLSKEEVIQIQELIHKLIEDINKKLIENTCKSCNFSTYKNENYKKHLESQNHKLKIGENNNQINVKKNIYNCDICGHNFNQNIDLIRHKNKKKLCKSDPQENAVIPQFSAQIKLREEKFKCNYCGKEFSRSDVLSRHINKYCKKKKEDDSQKEQIFKKLLEKLDFIEKQNHVIIEENKELKNEIFIMKNNPSKKIKNKLNNGTINKTNNNIIDNSQTFNIQLVAYGKENYDKLTDKEYRIIINKGFKSIQEMVKALHFNKNRPENHNIYISNIRDNYVMIYDGNKWELRNRKETIQELFIAKKDILVDKFDELLDKLPEHAINKFERFINDVQDDKIKEGILEELKLMLYNNKNIPMKTKEKLGLLK